MATVLDLVNEYVSRKLIADAESNHPTEDSAHKGDAHRALAEAEENLLVALDHVGPVVFGRTVIYSAVPPRTGRVGSIRFRHAKDVPWPPEPPQPPPEPEPKVAGYAGKESPC